MLKRSKFKLQIILAIKNKQFQGNELTTGYYDICFHEANEYNQ